MGNDLEQLSPDQALMSARIMWAATITGQIVLAGVVFVVADPTRRDASLADTFFYIAMVALVVLTPLAYFVRNQVYKANWVEHAITPKGYVTGNLALFAMLEVPSLIALVGGIVAHEAWRPMIVFVSAVVVLAINFPNGKPMQPTKVEGGS